MKPKIFIVAITLLISIVYLNAQQNITFDNPTDNTFNTNTTPFDEKRTEGLREEYNTFGNKHRNINVKPGSYDHYNQIGSQQSILGNQDVVVNRPQSTTLNNNFNYSNQNSNRKIDNTNSQPVKYNTPMAIEQINRRPLSSASDEIIIEIDNRQNISFDKESGKVEEGTLPNDPYDKMPIGDAIPFIVMLAALYAFIIRRKE